jgi:hypothetical protein
MFPFNDTRHSPIKLHQARFAEVLDTRQRCKVLHRLDAVLMVALRAVPCDGDSFTDMEDFAQAPLLWLRRKHRRALLAPSFHPDRLAFLHAQALFCRQRTTKTSCAGATTDHNAVPGFSGKAR